MRKTQLAIIEKAAKKNFQSNKIELLSSEEYDIRTLQNIYNFYSSHQEDVDNPSVYFEIHSFFVHVLNELNFSGYHADLFYGLSIKDILWIKNQYEDKIFSADDILQLSYIHYRLKLHKIHEMLEFFRERKEVIKSIPKHDNSNTLWASLCHLYSKFPALPLKDKIQIEYNFLVSSNYDNITSYTQDIGNDYYKATMNYMTRNLTPIFEIIKKYYDCRYEREDDKSNGFDFYFFSYPDTETVNSIKEIVEKFPNLLGTSTLNRDIIIDAVNPKPFYVYARASTTGISIGYFTFNKYKAKYENRIIVEQKDYCVKILFTYDYHCFIFNAYSKKWIPISLPQISMLYRYDFWKDIFNSYIDIISEEGTVWKDLKKSFNNGSGMPPLIANDVLLFKTKKNMMLSMYKKADIINWNKKDLYISYLVMKALPSVRESDKNILIDFVNRNNFTFPQDNININVKKLLCKVIINRFETHIDGYEADEAVIRRVRDYLTMSKNLHRKVSLSFNSPNSLQEAHDEVMIIYRNKHVTKLKIPKNSKFLELRKLLPDDFEWIKTKKRLIEEGEQMHHCVASYDWKINDDKCAIYSILYKNKRYTIEFSYNRRENKYGIVQIQGKYDSGCPANLRKYVSSFL